jgi:sirohydrochlorin cobaltochelatase
MAQSMSSAPFVWLPDGRPDWGSMWTSFCELALFGGPPQRGPGSALRASTSGDGCDAAMLTEMRRGIWETTGLYAESSEPGRLVVSCDSPAMAQWMATAIALENVEARADEDRILLPAGPGYRIDDEVKSIITVVAKTHHYWQAHVMGAEQADSTAAGDS